MEENYQLVKDCFALEVGQSLTRDIISFDDLFNLKYPVEYFDDPLWGDRWYNYEITAMTTNAHEMGVWNGNHPVELNIAYHMCAPGATVLVWMVSRLGDVGITDNLIDARGYAARINPDLLKNWTIKKMRK